MSVNDIEKERSNFEHLLKQLIGLLPSSYNKEVNDTNYYRLLRSLALELSTATIEIQQLKDDNYLNTVSPERIYDNFGTLVKLKKNPEWDDEKYRKLVQGVMSALLKGPTRESLIESFKLFTNLNVNVYELYKDADKVDRALYQGYNPLFTFVFEVEKPLETMTDQNALTRDASYIVNIIKPAHTIGIIITTLIGEESYRKHYKEKNNIPDSEPDYLNMDVIDTTVPEGDTIDEKEYYDKQRNQVNLLPKDNIFGYKYQGAGLFTTMRSRTNSTDLIAPKYTLYDHLFSEITFEENGDRFNMVYSQGSFEFTSHTLRSRLTWGSDTLIGEVRDLSEFGVESDDTYNTQNLIHEMENIYLEGSRYNEIFPTTQELSLLDISLGLCFETYDLLSAATDRGEMSTEFKENYLNDYPVTDLAIIDVEDFEAMYTPNDELIFETDFEESYLLSSDTEAFMLNDSRLTEMEANAEVLGTYSHEVVEMIDLSGFQETYNRANILDFITKYDVEFSEITPAITEKNDIATEFSDNYKFPDADSEEPFQLSSTTQVSTLGGNNILGATIRSERLDEVKLEGFNDTFNLPTEEYSMIAQ